MATVAIHNLTDTWNDGGTTFTAIKMDVTNTASGASSALMDLLVGGVSKFWVGKSGSISIADTANMGWATRGFLDSSADGVWTLYNGAGTSFGRLNWGGTTSSFPSLKRSTTALHVRLADDSAYTTLAAGTIALGGDALLTRDAADILAQSNGVNGQIFRIYNTFTDASNYERLAIDFSAPAVSIATQAAGSGTKRAITLSGSTVSLVADLSQPIQFLASTAGIWSILNTGHLVVDNDATHDIGTSGARRPRNLYLSGIATIGGAATISGVVTAAAGTSVPAGGSTAARLLLGSTAGFGFYYGSGAPTVAAAKGSIYLRSDGSGVADRLYVNTDADVTWTAVATAT